MVNNTVGTTFTANSGQYVSATNAATAAANQFTTAANQAKKAASGGFGQGGSFGKAGGSSGGSFGNPGTVQSNPFNTVGGSRATVTKITGTNPFQNAASIVSEGLDGLVGTAKQAAVGLGVVGAFIGGIVEIGKKSAEAGWSLMKTAADFDALKMSLKAFDGKGAEAELNRLRTIGKLPGLGFQGAVQAYTGLRNADFDRASSERIIREVANANARGGGNNETFETVMMHLRELASQQFANERNIRGISNARIPINRILQEQFGTADSEALKQKGVTSQQVIAGLIDSLSKLERVAGSERTQIDNVGDALHNAEVTAGEALNQGLLPYVADFEKAVEDLTENGSISAAFESVAENIKSIFDSQEDGLEGAIKGLTQAAVQLSIGARNLAENGQGAGDALGKVWQFFQWVGQPGNYNAPWDPDQSRSGSRKDTNDEHWNTAAGEASWTAQGNDAEVGSKALQKERARYRDAHKAGLFAGSWKEWQALNKDDRDKIEAKQPSKDGNNGNANKGTTTQDKAVPLLQRIAAGVEKGNDIQTQLQGGSTQARNVTDAYGTHRTLGRHGGGSGVRVLLMSLADMIEAGEAMAHGNAAADRMGRVHG